MAEIKLKIASVVIGSGEGGGSGVAPYYADLPDKPSINGEILSGDMTSEDLGLASPEQSVPAGGTTGQVLAKKSNADNDVQWVNQESGEQGTTDYADLENKPKINNVTLSGNKTAAQLGLQAELVSGTNIKTINNQSIVGSGNITIESGGTEVEANPTGEATETLGKLKIGETIYTAPQGPQGEPGATGATGATGPANTLTIGTVTDGEQASASITGNAPSQTLNLVLPKGEKGDTGNDAVNPFKGWFNAVVTGEAGSRVITSETQNLPANPVVGDYAYVKTWDISGTAPSQTETPIAKIYECTTAGTWSDSGRTADTSNVQTFVSGEKVNETYIDNTGLLNPTIASLAKAKDVKDKISRNFSDEAKVLLLSVLRKCVYTESGVGNSINDLEDLLYGDKVLEYITAASTQGQAKIYTDEDISVVRNYIEVTAYYSDGSYSTITSYEISGTLEHGQSQLTVTYSGKSTTVTINAIFRLVISDSEILNRRGISNSYINEGSDIPYCTLSYSTAIRSSYPHFDKMIGGGTYDITVTSNYSTTEVACAFMTQRCINAMAQHEDLQNGAGWTGFTSSWLSLGTSEVSVPDFGIEGDALSEIKFVRLSVRKDSNNSNMPADLTCSVTIIKK